MIPFYFARHIFIFEDDDFAVEGGEGEIDDGAGLILFLGEGQFVAFDGADGSLVFGQAIGTFLG